jgi:hypothetical protein
MAALEAVQANSATITWVDRSTYTTQAEARIPDPLSVSAFADYVEVMWSAWNPGSLSRWDPAWFLSLASPSHPSGPGHWLSWRRDHEPIFWWAYQRNSLDRFLAGLLRIDLRMKLLLK